jgi:hypothetical protein
VQGAEVGIRKREQEQFSEEIKSPGNRLVQAGRMMVDFMVFSSQECGNSGLDVKENRFIA